MPLIHFEFTKPQKAGVDAPATGLLRLRLINRQPITGKIRTTEPFPAYLVNGSVDVELSVTPAGYGWEVAQYIDGEEPVTEVVIVAADSVNFSDLVRVSVRSLKPTAGNVDAWIAALSSLRRGQRSGVAAINSSGNVLDAEGNVLLDRATADGAYTSPTQLATKLSKTEASTTFAPRKLAAPMATSGAAVGAMPPAVAARTFREYPTWDKMQTKLLPFASQSAPSILGMFMVDMRGWPGALDNIYMFYSTDHGIDATTTGIYLVTMSDPYGANLVDRGKVLGGGSLQPEAPQVWLDWDAGVIRFLVSINTGETTAPETQAAQTTVMYTSPTGLTAASFTSIGTTMAKEALRPGVPVTEYPKIIARIGNSMYAYTIDGGGAYSLWYSTQGGLPGTWYTSGGRILNQSDLICALPGYDIQWLAKIGGGGVVSQRGQLWWSGSIIGPTAGVEGFALSELYTAPLRPDMRGFAATPVLVTPPLAPWETDRRFGSLGSAFQYDTTVVLPYRTAEKNTDIGLLILNQGA